MLLGEKDDMTLPKPCMELADELAANGNPVTYKTYAGATHVFDRLNQKWAQYREGNYNKCSMDTRMLLRSQRSLMGACARQILRQNLYRRE